jgi:hypothetical protein
MNAVDIVMQMFGAMNVDEKRQVVLSIANDTDMAALMPVPAEATTSAPKRKGKGGFKPYWMKTATGIDTTKKGMFRVEGDWCNDPNKETAGKHVIVGIKDPKEYILCRVERGSQVAFEASGRTQIVDGLAKVSRGTSFGDIEQALAATL